MNEIKIKNDSTSLLLECLSSETPPTTNVGKDVGRGSGECKLVQPLWKTIWRLLEKLNIDLPYDPWHF
jgi:hypothetical protein